MGVNNVISLSCITAVFNSLFIILPVSVFEGKISKIGQNRPSRREVDK